MAELYKLRNHIRHYEWGSREYIPRLLGLPAGGKPWAEMWMGSHAASPSAVCLPSGETSLAELISGDPPRYLGGQTARRYGGLPFLFKLLAAGKPLSIQAHPNLALAREGFARENAAALPLDAPTRNYKDPNHKPELICALSPFTGICGFRDPAEIQRLVAAFLDTAPGALREGLAPLLKAPVLELFFSALFSLPPGTRRTLTEYILAAHEPSGPGEWDLMRNFARLYPGDPGIIAPLYLNVFRLEPGEAVFLKAGTLHAYISGFGVELMANSDNVLRGGLTSKHVDLPELMKALDFSPSAPEIIRPVGFTYPVFCEEFSLRVLYGPADFRPDSPSICIVTEGEAAAGDSGDTVLTQGESAFIPPAGESITLRGRFTMYIASTGSAAECGAARENSR